MQKIKDFLTAKKISVTCWIYSKMNEASNLVDEVNHTRFTKKIPKKIATICSAMLVAMLPTTAFAAGNADTSTIDGFVDFACSWLIKIGLVVMLVGGVMFALGWQRDDAEGKTRGLQTVMAGAMVAALGKSPDIFGL